MDARHFETGAFRFLVGLGVSAALALSGCANTTDPRVIAEATTAKYDPYTKTTSILGDMVQKMDFPNTLSYRLRGGVRTNEQAFLQLYVTYWSQSGWYFINSANDIDGISLPVVQINREVKSGANVEETVGVTLSRKYLDDYKSSGLNIRLAGQRGSVIVKVPSAYIIGFMTKFDAVVAQSGNSASQ